MSTETQRPRESWTVPTYPPRIGTIKLFLGGTHGSSARATFRYLDCT
jgi:hypothetical protein